MGTGLIERAPTPRLSIGLPVRNGEPTLEATLRSLLTQSFDDFELLISDNNSTDRTGEIGRSFAATDPRVRYERNSTNLGLAANFNRVFARTRGPLFKWASGDDIALPGFLSRCVGVLDEQPDVVLACTKTQFIDANSQPLAITDPGWHLPQESADERFRRVLAAGHWVNSLLGVIRRDALVRTRLLPAYIGGDYVLLGQLSLLGKFVEVPVILQQRRLHEGSMSRHHADPSWVLQYWGRGVKAALPNWCRLRDELGSIARASLPLRRKLGLYGFWLNEMRWRRSQLWEELLTTMHLAPAPGNP